MGTNVGRVRCILGRLYVKALRLCASGSKTPKPRNRASASPLPSFESDNATHTTLNFESVPQPQLRGWFQTLCLSEPMNHYFSLCMMRGAGVGFRFFL
jgi:hypothetical protein